MIRRLERSCRRWQLEFAIQFNEENCTSARLSRFVTHVETGRPRGSRAECTMSCANAKELLVAYSKARPIQANAA